MALAKRKEKLKGLEGENCVVHSAFSQNIDIIFSMSCFSQKFYMYSSNFKPCKLVKTQFQSIVFLSPPNSAAKNTWSLYLIELLIRGQIDQLGFAFFLFSAFLTCTRVNVDCMFPDEGRLNCVSKHYDPSFQVLSKNYEAFSCCLKY